MHPTLCTIGPFTLYAYGLCSALAMLLAYGVSLARAQKQGFSKDFISDFLFWVFSAGVLGARAAYVLQNLSEFKDHIWSVFFIWQGGLVWYGGMLSAILAGWVMARRHKQNLVALADFIAPVLPLAHGIGRIGCFLNGCCGGKLIFGVQQPVQLYESAGLFTLSGILFWSSKKSFKPGMVFVLYLFGYGFLRLLLEFWREGQELFGGLTLPQWVSLILILLSGFLWKRLK